MRSGPDSRQSLSDVPAKRADASRTTRSFFFLGCRTPWWGSYHNMLSSRRSLSSGMRLACPWRRGNPQNCSTSVGMWYQSISSWGSSVVGLPKDGYLADERKYLLTANTPHNVHHAEQWPVQPCPGNVCLHLRRPFHLRKLVFHCRGQRTAACHDTNYSLSAEVDWS